MFDPDECERLAREMAEDAGGFEGEFRFVEAHTEDHGIGNIGDFVSVPDRLVYIDAIDGDPHTIVDDIEQHVAEPIVRMLNNARAASEQLRAAVEEVERLTGALTKISAIRDSIVGMQGFNFSEHAYPLVAALDAAGFMGAGYEISRANLGTLIEQRNKAESERDRLAAEVERLTKERDEAKAGHEACIASLASLKADYDALAKEQWAAVDWDDVRSFCAMVKLRDDAVAERDLLTANLRALTADLAKYRALVEQMRPVYELAQRLAHNFNDTSGSMSRIDAIEDTVTAIAAKVGDTALAAPKETK